MIYKITKGIRERLTDPFWKNVATLFSGSAIAQAMPILIFPILTRIYTKEALGFYFIFAGIGLITQILATMHFELAIVIPKDKQEANHVTKLSLWIAILVSLVMLFGVFLFHDFIALRIKQQEFVPFLYAIPLSAFLLGVFRVATYYLNRQKMYKYIAVGKVAKTITFTIFQLIFGFVGYVSGGLIWGLIIGQFISAVYVVSVLFIKSEFEWTGTLKELIAVVRKYRDMPLYNTLISVVVNLSNQLPVFFLSRYFNVGYSGDFGLANRVVSSPMELVGSSVGQVFFKEAADVVNRKGNLYQLVKVTYLRLFKIAIIPFVILLLLAPWLFGVFFSSEYQISGQMTQILVPWLFLNFLNSPVSFLFDVLNKQRFMSVFQIVYLLTRIIGLFLGYYLTNNILITIAIFSVIGVVFNSFTIYYYLHISKTTNYQIYQ
jgi:O-antigen/teichoic acid export membrane protein